ncbi:MAG: protease, partial [Nanoarchaeota archaeon]
DPEALSSALIKIHEGAKINPLRFGSPAAQSIFIARPYVGTGLLSLLSTHPSLESRVQKLRALKV